MNMKKRGFIGRLAALAMVLCLVTMSLTAGTLAKYASQTDGKAVATVAAWKIAFKDGTGASANTYTGTGAFTLDLEDEAKVTDKLVAADRVAPGTSGSFNFVVDATDTEVAFTYTIDMDFSGTGLDKVPLKFSDKSDFSSTLSMDASKHVKLTGDVLTDAITSTPEKTVTVYWQWDSTNYSSTTDEDKRDTEVGVASATTQLKYEIPVTIIAEQKLTTT